MDKKDLAQLLSDKIKHIDVLAENYDKDALRQWKEETLMILDNLIDENSKYYQNFEKIQYYSGVTSMMDPEGNRVRHEEAYRSGLQKARSSLKAVIFGIEKGLIV